MKIGVLFSGGKDSCFAAHAAHLQAKEVILFTIYPSDRHSEMYHHPNLWITGKISGLMGMGHIQIKGEDRESLLRALGKHKIDMLYGGAIESEYQRWFFNGVADELGIPLQSPLWRKQDTYLEEVTRHFETVFVRVAADGMGKELLGRTINGFNAPPGVHPCFEGGEAETLVLDAPLYSRKLEIAEATVVSEGMMHTLEIKKVNTVDKE